MTISQSEPFYISMNYKNIGKYSIIPIHNDYIFLFDIDDTLYKPSVEMCIAEMDKWKAAYDFFKLEKSNVPYFDLLMNPKNLYTESFRQWFNKSPYETETVRNFDVKNFLKRDENLKSFLENIKYRKWCFTNATKLRAQAILECLGLCDVFEGVICLDDENVQRRVQGKPDKNMYSFVEDLLQIQDRNKVYFFDDSVDNIKTGIRMGWNSVYISKEDDLIDKVSSILVKLKTDLDR